MEDELLQHKLHKVEAREAVREVLRMCQMSANELTCSPELREFKNRVFSTLEMPTINLRWGTDNLTMKDVSDYNQKRYEEALANMTNDSKYKIIHRFDDSVNFIEELAKLVQKENS
jgi:hypothetical protein